MLTKRRIIYHFISRNKLLVFGTFIFSFLSIFTTILIPVFLGKYYQIALENQSKRCKIFDSIFGTMDNITSYFITFTTLILLKLFFDYYMKYYTGVSGEFFSKSLREKLFSKQLTIKFEAHQKKEIGLYLLRYSGDLAAIQNYFTKGLVLFINDCFFLLFVLVILVFLSLPLSIVVIVFYPIAFFTILILNKRLKQINSKRRNIKTVNLNFVSSRLTAISTIKVFNREKIENEKYQKGSKEFFKYGIKYNSLYAMNSSLFPFFMYIILGILLYTAFEINNNEFHSIPGYIIISFILLIVNTIPVLKRILRVNFIWQAGEISFRKVIQIFNTEQEEDVEHLPIKIENGNITFKNVTFSFNEKALLFDTISFSIPSASLNLIDGNHQSGKSTLFKLLTGLYTIDNGEILIDNVSISSISKHSLRKNVAIVSDEFVLIGKTVFETISNNKNKENRTTAFQMLVKLGFTSSKDDDQILDSPIHENGKNISYSQRKILNIARAFLTEKKIILLDEPFEGLDEILSERIFNVLKSMKANHTILIIDKSKKHIEEYGSIIDLNEILSKPVDID